MVLFPRSYKPFQVECMVSSWLRYPSFLCATKPHLFCMRACLMLKRSPVYTHKKAWQIVQMHIIFSSFVTSLKILAYYNGQALVFEWYDILASLSLHCITKHNTPVDKTHQYYSLLT